MAMRIAAILFFAAVSTAAATAGAVPSYEQVRRMHRPSESLLVDRSGEVLHELRIDPAVRRLAWVEIGAISPALLQAVVRAEDRRFHEHGGVDLRAAAAAAARRLSGGTPRGASTITMQLAAMLDPGLQPQGRRRSLAQKWRQAKAAWELEALWDKKRILEAYLNRVYFFGELQGIGAAARGLFGKEPHGLNRVESLLLATLIRAPNATADEAAARAAALGRALEWEIPSTRIRGQSVRALAAPKLIAPPADLAPHLARRLLKAAPPGSRVPSTLDAELQLSVVELLAVHLEPLRESRVGEAAVLVAANPSGEVLAYASRTSDPARSRFVDGVAARRQAGSTLKPFLYAAALDRRILTAASLLEDRPLDLSVSGGIYQPRSYDGGHAGPVSVRTALGSSLNVPAVKAAELLGVEAFLGVLRALGVEGLGESGDFYGPALALGTADVTLWELVAAYRALANGGEWSALRAGPEEPPAPLTRRVFSEEAAFVAADILADREARRLGFGLENVLSTRYWTAAKTGTSKDLRDNWCIGFSEAYTVGVWVGNYSGEPMWDVSGVAGAAPIWRDVMDRLHRRESSRPAAPPRGLVRGGHTGARPEWFLRGTDPPPAGVYLARGVARIAYPPDEAILSFDPDIPRDRQKLFFLAAGGAQHLRWTLNGRPLPPAVIHTGWEIVPGRYLLCLRDGDGVPIDEIRFSVRGASARRP
ncbi:MAG: penicillin-binding protein 1C [Desulfobacterales bacterium]|jgi:penicillin-binding protein 1C|nr:penicillin-binding protein 1C [Desulfobacterales bacterium]